MVPLFVSLGCGLGFVWVGLCCWFYVLVVPGVPSCCEILGLVGYFCRPFGRFWVD